MFTYSFPAVPITILSWPSEVLTSCTKLRGRHFFVQIILSQKSVSFLCNNYLQHPVLFSQLLSQMNKKKQKETACSVWNAADASVLCYYITIVSAVPIHCIVLTKSSLLVRPTWIFMKTGHAVMRELPLYENLQTFEPCCSFSCYIEQWWWRHCPFGEAKVKVYQFDHDDTPISPTWTQHGVPSLS